MKIISAILTLILLSSCTPSWVGDEVKKSAKSGAASGRINSSESNSRDVFKELDE
jgi:hypothetical protein